MTQSSYTAEDVKRCVDARREELFEPYARGRPPGWSCDRATSDLICIGNWLNTELTTAGASNDDRRAMLWSFNRRARAEFDVFRLGADIMTEFCAGNIDRKPAHRRWG